MRCPPATFAITAALALAACRGGNTEPPPLPPAAVSAPVAQAVQPCPTLLDDARVRTEIVNGGVALVFYATDGDAVGPLRERVHALAAENPAGAEGMTTSVTDTPDGARIDFISRDVDPDGLIELRDQVDAMAERLEGGECTVRVSAR